MQKATVGGILTIVASSIGILVGLIYLVYVIFLTYLVDSVDDAITLTRSESDPFLLVFWVMFGAVFLFHLILGLLGIAGGICAIRKKAWGLALAGAIASSVSFYFLGIAAVVLVAMAQSEFNKPAVAAAGVHSVPVVV